MKKLENRSILKQYNYITIQFPPAINNVMIILFFVVDWIGTAFIISKGSNSIHDLLKRIKPIEVKGNSENV